MGFLLAVTGGFASGVLLRSLFVFSWPVMVFALLISGLAAIIPRIFEEPRRRVYMLCGVFLLCAALGMARMHLADVPPPSVFLAEVGEKVTYEGVVVREPDVRDTHQRIAIAVEREGERVTVLAVADRYGAVEYGDQVRVTGTLALPEPFDTTEGRVFRYDKFLQKDGIYFLINFSSVEVIEPYAGTSLYAFLYRIKNLFTNALGAALPEPSASLANGLILGGKQGLGEELKQAFITSGLIHVVVLSGYNVMIVALAVLWFFSFLSRRSRTLLAGITVGLFVLMAGTGAASTRAGLMALIGLYARAYGRTFDALRALLFVGCLMLLSNPFSLLYDPGFQLSFIATLGLILGAPLIGARLVFIKNEFLREILASTISAQVAVLPLLLYQTGLLSFVALIANILVLPMIPLAMLLAFLAGLLALLIPPAAVVVGFPAYMLLTYIITVAEKISALPLSAVSLPAFPFAFVLLAYAALSYFVWRATKLSPGALLPHSN